jgi:hypothetical protein
MWKLEFLSVLTAISQHKLGLFDLLESLGIQEGEVPKIPRQSGHKGEKVVSHTHRPPLPQGEIPGTHFF